MGKIWIIFHLLIAVDEITEKNEAAGNPLDLTSPRKNLLHMPLPLGSLATGHLL